VTAQSTSACIAPRFVTKLVSYCAGKTGRDETGDDGVGPGGGGEREMPLSLIEANRAWGRNGKWYWKSGLRCLPCVCVSVRRTVSKNVRVLAPSSVVEGRTCDVASNRIGGILGARTWGRRHGPCWRCMAIGVPLVRVEEGVDPFEDE